MCLMSLAEANIAFCAPSHHSPAEYDPFHPSCMPVAAFVGESRAGQGRSACQMGRHAEISSEATNQSVII
jgi:hypothetical protein